MSAAAGTQVVVSTEICKANWFFTSASMTFSDAEISDLIKGSPLGRLRYETTTGEVSHSFLRDAIGAAAAKSGTAEVINWDPSGVDYASFVEGWFYFKDGQARKPSHLGNHLGICILFNRFTTTYALGQGSFCWGPSFFGSSAPGWDTIDMINHPALAEAADTIDDTLTGFGLHRLCRRHLEPFISTTHRVPTILSSPPYRVFDVLFHWMD